MSFAAGLTEVGLLLTGMFILCIRRGLPARDAVLSALILVPAGLSCLFQICFLAGEPWWSLGFEAAALAYSLVLLLRHHRLVTGLLTQVAAVVRQSPLVIMLLGLCLFFLGAQALLQPEGNQDSLHYNLARVLMFQQERSLFLTHLTEYHQAIFPVGGDILSHLFLRFYADYGLGLFSFIAFLAIISGTYALARRYGAPQQALAATAVIAGMPLVIYQATGTKPDILGAAIALFCLSVWYRLYDALTVRDATLLIIGLCFGVSTKTTFLAFVVPATCCFTFALLHRHGMVECRKIFKLNRQGRLLAGMSLAILFPGWLFAWNYASWGHWAGPPEFVFLHQQTDGMLGMAANLFRYLFQSIHLLTPFDLLSEKLSGVRFTSILKSLYEGTAGRVFGAAGVVPARYPFDIDWSDNENGAWFGPFSVLLGWPALALALRRGAPELRATAWSIVGYVLFVCWQVGWMPWNCRFFSLGFVCTGPLIAYFVTHFQWRLVALKALQWGGVCILVYGCGVNQQKHVFSLSKWRTDPTVKNIPSNIILGRDRQHWNRWYFRDERIAEFKELLPAHARVGLAGGGLMLVFPYMLSRPDIAFVPLLPGESASGHNLEYLVCDQLTVKRCLALTGRTAGSVVWEAKPVPKGRKGVILQIQADVQGTER